MKRKVLLGGIWIRDIRVQCNVGVTQATRILKTLETKKLIKTVKSVAVRRKKGRSFSRELLVFALGGEKKSLYAL